MRVPLRRELRAALGERELWIFGYGSLMWDPGFRYAEAEPALLHGYHRRFCVYSHRYRGTPESPGLVLGLDRGGNCWGVAYRVAKPDAKAALHYLWDRELDGGVYRMERLRVRLKSRAVHAHAFVVNRGHRSYAGVMAPEQAANLITAAIGARGPCRRYLENPVNHLSSLGLEDRALCRLLEMIGRLDPRNASSAARSP
jgi:cation transport protein ChaC